MKYCISCGKKIGDNALDCPKCGEPTIKRKIRKKSTAVILAVFLGQLTWIYTYKHDAWKFWLGLGLCLIGPIFLFLPNIGVWIWSIVDVCKKEERYYKNY